jgi:hypothetical protein
LFVFVCATPARLAFWQTNFAEAPPIEITFRLQLFGFDECFDAVRYEVYIPAPRQFESFRDVIDDARNLHESRLATRQDGLIDQDISHRHWGPHIRKHNADTD